MKMEFKWKGIVQVTSSIRCSLGRQLDTYFTPSLTPFIPFPDSVIYMQMMRSRWKEKNVSGQMRGDDRNEEIFFGGINLTYKKGTEDRGMQVERDEVKE